MARPMREDERKLLSKACDVLAETNCLKALKIRMFGEIRYEKGKPPSVETILANFAKMKCDS